MPLEKKWSTYTKNNVRETEKNTLGVYELGNDDDILYIGEGQVQNRLLDHFSDGSDPTPGCSNYRVEYSGVKETAVSRQNAELRKYEKQHGRLPKYNQKSRA